MSDDSIIRVGDDDRDRAVSRLREACGEGRLTLEEFTDRMGAAFAATTRGDLDALVADLPVGGSPSSVTAARSWVVAVFGGNDKRGRWAVAPDLKVISVFGGCDVDLREAVVPSGEVTVTSVSVFGGNDVIVPEGADVDVSGFALFGGNDVSVPSPAVAGAPRIRVRAISLFGGTDVIEKSRTALRRRG